MLFRIELNVVCCCMFLIVTSGYGTLHLYTFMSSVCRRQARNGRHDVGGVISLPSAKHGVVRAWYGSDSTKLLDEGGLTRAVGTII